jgi:hypothetical protein
MVNVVNQTGVTQRGLTVTARSYDMTGRVIDTKDASVGGTVPATLTLTLGAPASFGAYQPGAAHDYTASTTADAVSTAGDATPSVADPSLTATGHLVNGTFSLPQSLLVQAAGGAFAAVSATPTALHAYAGPVSHDMQTVAFKQSIGAGDALRTGTYSKTLTFTLSTTQP